MAREPLLEITDGKPLSERLIEIPSGVPVSDLGALMSRTPKNTTMLEVGTAGFGPLTGRTVQRVIDIPAEP